ncbi:MAG: filamentous hemagglutinin N-terminal domain-containing protein [Waterburya sp.]
MAKAFFSCVLRQLGVAPLFQICLSTLGYLYLTSDVSLAQVTSDGTVNTQVNQNGNVAEITGGETRGGNLFHSFRDFSVGTGNEASFLNADTISNIFSRVTGGNISNIDGLIRANGSANLFLINPAGILFGENARLDVGGSFYGSTASSILFEDGEFSATDLSNPPVLTINAPIGLNLRDNPEPIVNRSIASDPSTNTSDGLKVDPGKNISFVGGNINFEGGKLTAQAGRVNLGGLSTAGTIGITNEGSLSFPDGVARSDVSFTQEAFVGVSGTRGGNIDVNAANIQITEDSLLQGGTFADVGLADSQSGDINLNATGIINIDGSTIDNISEIGNTGDIKLNAPNEIFIKNSQVLAGGNFGRIFIGDSVQPSQVTLEGQRTTTENSPDPQFSNLLSTTSSNTDDLAGSITINARDNINIIGTDIQSSTATTRLYVDPTNQDQLNGSIIQLSVAKENPLGKITIEQSRINTSNSSTGYAGDVKLNAPNEISIKNSGIFAQGNFGRIFIGDSIQPSQVTLEGQRTTTEDGSNFQFSNFLSTDSFNTNDITGDITINARDSIKVIGSDIQSQTETTRLNFDPENQDGRNFSTIALNVSEANPIGKITIEQSRINTSNSSTGYAGDVKLNAPNEISIKNSGIFARGNFGRIFIGDSIQPSQVTLDNSWLDASTAIDSGGNITLEIANDLTLRNNSYISAEAFNDADGGNLTIDARFIVAFPSNGTGNNLVAAAEQGEGGTINLNAQQIFGLKEGQAIDDQRNLIENNDNDVDASSGNPNLDGTVNINTDNINPVQGATELPNNVVEAEQTTEQVCQADRETEAKNGLIVRGKGGIPAPPDQPLTSQNLIINGEVTPASAIPEPIETSQGKIQLARGIKVTKDGQVILTAYPTNNAGERVPQGRINCGQIYMRDKG